MPDFAGSFRHWLLLVLLALLLPAAGWQLATLRPAPAWQLADIAGHLPDLRFTLTGDDGKPVSERDFRGKTVLLIFGFTHCEGQCPVTLARLKTVIQALGKDAREVRVLFVSVDPARDTPPVLKRYLQAFDPVRMLGLTGSEAAIGELARRYRAVYRPGFASSTGLPHGTAVYIFDGLGRARLLATADDPDAGMEEDLKRLAHGF